MVFEEVEAVADEILGAGKVEAGVGIGIEAEGNNIQVGYFLHYFALVYLLVSGSPYVFHLLAELAPAWVALVNEVWWVLCG